MTAKTYTSFADIGFCPINCFASQCSTESPSDSADSSSADSADETLRQGFLQVRKELIQEMLLLYKAYRNLFSYKELFAKELTQIALRDKQRTDSGFIPNQGCHSYKNGMSQDEQLEARHICEKNALEHQKDEQRKREIQQFNNDAYMHREVKNKFEFILTLSDGISHLDEVIEKTMT